MDYLCDKFGDCTFSRFGFIMQTNRRTDIRRRTLYSHDVSNKCTLICSLRAVLWGVVNAAVDSRAAGLPAEMYLLDDDYRALLDTNLLYAAAVTSAFMPQLIASRGRVVNTGCLTGLIDLPANAPYGASMSALVAWSESLRLNVQTLQFALCKAVAV